MPLKNKKAGNGPGEHHRQQGNGHQKRQESKGSPPSLLGMPPLYGPSQNFNAVCLTGNPLLTYAPTASHPPPNAYYPQSKPSYSQPRGQNPHGMRKPQIEPLSSTKHTDCYYYYYASCSKVRKV